MKSFVVAAVAVCLAAPAFAGSIDFTSLANGTVVSNQFAGVSFMGSGGPDADGAPLASNVWTGGVVELNNTTSGDYPTQHFITATFSSAVSNLTFDFANYGTNFSSYADAYDGSGNLLAHISLGVAGNYDTTYSFGVDNISSVVWSNGFSYQNWEFGIRHISFDAAAVPEPASWAMMLGGFGMIGGAMRSRRGKVAVSFG